VFLITSFCSVCFKFEGPSVRLVRAEAAIGGYLEPPKMPSFPLALCQRKHVMAGIRKNAASARINRTESGFRSDVIFVAANCGPAGMKPAETLSASILGIGLLPFLLLGVCTELVNMAPSRQLNCLIQSLLDDWICRRSSERNALLAQFHRPTVTESLCLGRCILP